MRKLIVSLGFTAALVVGGSTAAQAADYNWIGPFPTSADCAEGAAFWRSIGGQVSACSYRDLPNFWQDGWYFKSWPLS